MLKRVLPYALIIGSALTASSDLLLFQRNFAKSVDGPDPSLRSQVADAI
jgi:hypothetical protein